MGAPEPRADTWEAVEQVKELGSGRKLSDRPWVVSSGKVGGRCGSALIFLSEPRPFLSLQPSQSRTSRIRQLDQICRSNIPCL